MTRRSLPFLPFVLGLAIGLAVTLTVMPGLIMSRAMDRIEALGGETGSVRHAPQVTAENQTIVRASPDILYSVCLYNLSDGPLRIDAPWPADGNYASVSFYDSNTNNFAAMSDRDVRTQSTSVLLTPRPVSENADFVAERQFSAPTMTGLVLYRRVVNANTDLAAADAERRRFTCTQLSDR